MHNTKGLEGGLDNTISYFKRQVTDEDGTNGLVSSGNRDGHITKQERRALKEFVSVLAGLAGDTNFATPQELDCGHFICV